MDVDQRAALVAAYVAGPATIRAAVDGLTESQLDGRPSDGGWTPREIVHHTADSDEFARRLQYATRPIGPALDAIAGARGTTAQILAGLTEAEWGRTGTHSESGAYGVERWLEIYAAHCHEHADQIRRALAGTQ